jgi:hypothetical protein
MNRTRHISTSTPALVAVVDPSAATTALTFPLIAVTATNSPLFLLATSLLLAAGMFTVPLSVDAAGPPLHQAPPRHSEANALDRMALGQLTGATDVLLFDTKSATHSFGRCTTHRGNGCNRYRVRR